MFLSVFKYRLRGRVGRRMFEGKREDLAARDGLLGVGGEELHADLIGITGHNLRKD
jgi:hypothetical protein